MDRGGVCPRCGTIRQPWATWCSGCGLVFELSSQPGATGLPPATGLPSATQLPPSTGLPPVESIYRPTPQPTPATPPQAQPSRPQPPGTANGPHAWLPPAPPSPLVPPSGRAARARSRNATSTITVGAVAAAVVVASLAVGLARINSTALPTAVPSSQNVGATDDGRPERQPPPSTPGATTVDGFLTFGDGTYVVGVDIPAGTYRAPDAGLSCSWSRISSIIGTSTTVADDGLSTGGPDVATIEPDDKAFETAGCGTWTSDLSRVTRSATSFGDGTYIVGVDVEPGQYRNDGSPYCVWARLNGFTGFYTSFIGGGTPTDAATITIQPTDKGFWTFDCGTWTKQ